MPTTTISESEADRLADAYRNRGWGWSFRGDDHGWTAVLHARDGRRFEGSGTTRALAIQRAAALTAP